MGRFTLIVGVLLAGALGAFLYWSLPSRDVVRILGTEVARNRAETTTQGGQVVNASRDVRYILAAAPSGAPRVYRNEDTDWGWPPYFKFDSADLAATAETFRSEESNPRWAIVTHYGWRIPLMSTFPNAIAVTAAEGPDQTLIPWLNIAILGGLFAAIAMLRWRLLSWFRDRAG